jgi:hypothetical protein
VGLHRTGISGLAQESEAEWEIVCSYTVNFVGQSTRTDGVRVVGLDFQCNAKEVYVH